MNRAELIESPLNSPNIYKNVYLEPYFIFSNYGLLLNNEDLQDM